MGATTQKKLEIVSAQEQVKSKKDQMLENIKMLMLEDLKLDDKLTKRSSVMEKIFEARENKEFPALIHFWANTIKISEKKNYSEWIAKYKAAAGNEELLKKLDKELSEEIILDYGKMIEFSSTENFEEKTTEEEARSSFERLDKNEKYNKKIELIKKTDGEESHFVIKRTEAQLKEIERAEKAYETIHGNEATEPNEQKQINKQWDSIWIPTLQETTETKETKETIQKMKEHGIKILWVQLKNMKIWETTDLTMPDGKIIRLQKKDDQGWICVFNQVPEFSQYIDKKYSVEDEEGNESYISHVRNKDLWKFLWIPEEQKMLPPHPEQKLLPPHPEQKLFPPHKEEPIPAPIEDEWELGSVELTATISDTTKITRAIAERQAGEKLRKIYKNTAWYKPWSWPTKAGLFLGRWFIKDHYTRKYMNMKKGMQRDENLVKGADRHEMEEANKFNEAIKNVGNIDEENYPRTYEAVNNLAQQLIGDANSMPPRQKGIADNDFQDQFRAIIRRNLDARKPATATATDWKPLADIIKDNDIQQMSSNITLKLNAFRDHQDMAWSIADRITRNPTESDASFNAFSRDKIIKYFNTYKKNPEFLKTMKIKLDDKNAMQELRRLQAHNWALTQIAAQTMRLKVQILAKGEEAYEVKQELTGFRWRITKAGNRLDKPISDTSRFGKWLEKHPFAKWAFWTLRWGAKLGIMITPAILLGLTWGWPLAIAGAAGGMAFAKTLLKKHAHYNKEHIGYQRNQSTNLLNNTQERERLMNEISNMSWMKRAMLYYFGLGKKARDVRQFRDYVMTTHDQLEDSNTLAAKMEWLLSKPQLTTQEQQQVERYISEWLARLDFHKKTGQNFLGSKDKDVAEKEYQSIYRLVLTWSMRLDQDLDTIRQNNYYDNEMDLINNGTGDDVDQIGYQKSRKRFKHRQTEKALLGAAKAWWIAFGLSYLATSLASSKTKVEINHSQTDVSDNFVLGKHELASDNNVYTTSKDFFQHTDKTINQQPIAFHYGWGTDATPVISWHLTQAEYLTKVADVEKEILQMSNITSATKSNLINQIHNKPWEQVRAEKWFTNDYLQGMRCIEGLEQTAKALNDSGNGGNITLIPTYDGSVHDIVGTTYNNAGERVVQWTMEYSTATITPENIIPIPVPGYMNTFKEPDRYEEDKNKKNTSGEDTYERKTRTPAPVVKKQTKNDKPPRRRSGERVDETQFTNANN